jgi:hypothetical protein
MARRPRREPRRSHPAAPLRAGALVGALFLLSACFGPDPNLTEGGQGKPAVSVDFPPSVPVSATATAVVHVTNPGPGAIRTLVVAFSLVGPAAGERGVPDPLVGFGAKGRNNSVVSISPHATAVSKDGDVYTFGPRGGRAAALPAGSSTAISFRLRTPAQPGTVANAVTVYDGSAPDRASGDRLETDVKP